MTVPLNDPTSIEKSEAVNNQLMQVVHSNNVDDEELPQNKKGKQSLQDQLEEVKKKKKEEFYASKKVSRKMIIQVAAKTCTPETQQ